MVCPGIDKDTRGATSLAPPTRPTLYYLAASSPKNFNSWSSLPDALKIVFEGDSDSVIENISTFTDSNMVEEPTISSDGTHSINKQDVGALPQGIVVNGYVKLMADDMIIKLRRFSRMTQLVEDHFEYGRFGFYSGVSEFFDIHPSSTIGYTLKPPTVEFTSGSPILRFSFRLLLGGVDLS